MLPSPLCALAEESERSISYDEFIEFLDNSNISNLICMPSTGFNIADKLKNKRNIIR